MEKSKKYYRYVGPESVIINSLSQDHRLFRKKEGHFVSIGEEVLVKISPRTEQLFDNSQIPEHNVAS